jgi:hypothetical protein
MAMSRNKSISAASCRAMLQFRCFVKIMFKKTFPALGYFVVFTAIALTALPGLSRSNRPQRPPNSGGSTPPTVPTNPIPVPRPSAGVVAQNSGNFGSNPSSARFVDLPTVPPTFNNSTNP